MGRPCKCCDYYGAGFCPTCYNGPETLTLQVTEVNCGEGGDTSHGCLSSGSFPMVRTRWGLPSGAGIFEYGTNAYVPIGCGVEIAIGVLCACRPGDFFRHYMVTSFNARPSNGYATDPAYCTATGEDGNPIWEPPGTPVLLEWSRGIFINFFPLVEMVVKFTITE